MQITVSPEKMTLGDLATLERWGGKGESVKATELIALLDRCVEVEGGAANIPLSELGAVAQAITESLNQKKAE